MLVLRVVLDVLLRRELGWTGRHSVPTRFGRAQAEKWRTEFSLIAVSFPSFRTRLGERIDWSKFFRMDGYGFGLARRTAKSKIRFVN